MNRFERSQAQIMERPREGSIIRIALFFLFLALPVSALAQSGVAPPPMPLERQEQVEQLNKAQSAIDNIIANIDESTTIKKDQCMKVFGNTAFCNCIAEKSPVGITFVGYISIVIGTKEDLKYDMLSSDDKKLIDVTRKARDECVSWKSK